MENNKIKNILKFYLLATELKDKIRSGWQERVWNVERERLESVAEHIYGCCILAIAIDSEFQIGIDLEKVIVILVIHELEEIKIGDLTPYDKVTEEEKRKMGKEAVCEILSCLLKKEQYIQLIDEFEKMETKEAKFAKMIDKLECDIQAKIYCEENRLDTKFVKNKAIIEDERIQKMIDNGYQKVSDFFIEYDKQNYSDEIFMEIVKFVKNNPLYDLNHNRFDRREI